MIKLNLLLLKRLNEYIKYQWKPEDSLKNITILPKDCGSSPTINSVVKFDLNLPKEEIFMPELQFEIYSHLFSEFINTLLGVFLLNVRT